MAKKYRAPELGEPSTKIKGALPLKESDGTVLVKFFFQGTDVPYGIPKREKRDAFPVIGGVRQDTGLCVLQRSGVSAQLLRTGLANADGHAWKLVWIDQWLKEISDPRTRARMIADGKEPVQTVVQLVYRSEPEEDKGRGPMAMTRPIRDAIAILAGCWSWTARVWFNDNGPITVNLTSPIDGDPEAALVIRDGALTFVEVEQSAPAATQEPVPEATAKTE